MIQSFYYIIITNNKEITRKGDLIMFRTNDPLTNTTTHLQLYYMQGGEIIRLAWWSQFDSLCSPYCVFVYCPQ